MSPYVVSLDSLCAHATHDVDTVDWRDNTPTDGRQRPTSDNMSDKPNRTTRELATEIARHMGVSATEVYEQAMRSMACAIYQLDQVLPDYGRVSARDLLAIARQIPTPDDDDGHGFSVRVPSLDTPDEYATLRRHPIQ